MNEIKYFGVFDSPYCLLIYLLAFTDQIDETCFFVSDGINKSIVDNLPFFHYYPTMQKNKHNSYFLKKITELLSMLKLNLKLKKIIKKYKKEDITVFGQDHITGGNFFVSRYTFNLIEDGLANYTEVSNGEAIGIFYKIAYKIFNIRKTFGLDDNVKSIYLTGLAPIPKCIQSKVHLIDLNEKWRNKTIDKKKKILEIFNFNPEILSKIQSFDSLLLTQPLSEDGLMSEIEKVELYRELLSNIDQNNLVIKVHPREKTDYKMYFPNSYILSNPFPVELLHFTGIRFKKVITLFSTAANDYLDSENELIFAGTECHEALLKNFGVIRYNEKSKKIEKIG